MEMGRGHWCFLKKLGRNVHERARYVCYSDNEGQRLPLICIAGRKTWLRSLYVVDAKARVKLGNFSSISSEIIIS